MMLMMQNSMNKVEELYNLEKFKSTVKLYNYLASIKLTRSKM